MSGSAASAASASSRAARVLGDVGVEARGLSGEGVAPGDDLRDGPFGAGEPVAGFGQLARRRLAASRAVRSASAAARRSACALCSAARRSATRAAAV